MGACTSKTVHTDTVHIQGRRSAKLGTAQASSGKAKGALAATSPVGVSPSSGARPCNGLSKPPSLYSLKSKSPPGDGDAEKSLHATKSAPRVQDVDMAQLDGDQEAEPEEDTIAPLAPVFNQSAPASSFKRRNMRRHTSGGSVGSGGSGDSASPRLPTVAASNSSIDLDEGRLLKHSQSTRLARSVSQSPYARGRYADGASIRRTTSLEGRFRTKSARLMVSRTTVETRKAIVSKDLDTNASSSDDDSSDGEPGPKNQQRFVNQYHIHELLGEGAFGKVYRCTDKEDNDTEYAVKILNKSFLKRKRVGRFGNMLQTVQREVAIWKKLKHPHVVHLFEVIDDPEHDHMYLINEYVPGGCVLPDEEEVEPIHPDKIHEYCAQLVDGLSFLHFEKIVHRDVKPGNLLIDAEGLMKIADFGVSQMFEGEDDNFRNTAGTASFMAPEMTTGAAFSGKGVDVWAAGITLYMMAYGHCPFRAKSQMEMYTKIQTEEVQYPATKFGELDPELKQVIQMMLVKDADARPTIDDIRELPYVAKYWKIEMTPLPDQPMSVTDQEVDAAFTSVHSISAIVRARRMSLQMLHRARERLQQHAHEVAMQQWFFGAMLEDNAHKKARQESLQTALSKHGIRVTSGGSGGAGPDVGAGAGAGAGAGSDTPGSSTSLTASMRAHKPPPIRFAVSGSGSVSGELDEPRPGGADAGAGAAKAPPVAGADAAAGAGVASAQAAGAGCRR